MILKWILTMSLVINIVIGCSQEVKHEIKYDSLNTGLSERKLTGEIISSTVTPSSNYYYDWDYADIVFNNGETVINKKLRYDGYLNEMIWLTPDEKLVKIEKENIKEVNFKKLHASFRQISIKTLSDSIKIFAEVLYENKISLFVYRKIKLEKIDMVNENNIIYPKNNFSYSPVYYVKFPDSQSIHSFTRINMNSFRGLFELRRDEVKKLLKQNHVNIKSEKDFVAALRLIEKNYY